MSTTTIECDRKTHTKIIELQNRKKLIEERYVAIPEIIRDAVNYYYAEGVKEN